MELKGNFWAASSRASRDVKRAEVRKLAKLVTRGRETVFPLSQEAVEGVKLMHVEEGFELPPWLNRVFSLCKKALLRNRGPTKKAGEAKLEDVSEDLWVQRGGKFEGKMNPALAYAWACLWMLREIEASACKWEHAQAEEQARTVSLTIPVSKMDQGAKGVKRTLQCCGEMPCKRFCAWNVWKRMEKETNHNMKKKGYLFVDGKGKQLSKCNTVKLWNQATSQKVSGHSARRSGAMEHVRQGLHINELASLGRWRSAVVLTYANDALQEVPANKMTTFQGQGTELDIRRERGHQDQTHKLPCGKHRRPQYYPNQWWLKGWQQAWEWKSLQKRL